MIRTIVNTLPYMALGVVLSSLGASPFAWQFWVAVFSMVAAQVLAAN